MSWKNECFISLDLETTGAFPFESEICEIGAVKWKGGKIIDKYEVLIKPSHTIPDEIIAIHGITNEMLENSPTISEKIHEFYDFIQDGYLIAHHAPFDMGFLAFEFEKRDMDFPIKKALCSSLLSRQLIPESPNHKLVTLRKTLNLTDNNAHRAYDDSISCLELAMVCFERMGNGATIKDLFAKQGGGLDWQKFSMKGLMKEPAFTALVQCFYDKKEILEIIYMGGSKSKKGQWRKVVPVGLVRNPSGDFLVAKDEPRGQPKRFYLSKVQDSR